MKICKSKRIYVYKYRNIRQLLMMVLLVIGQVIDHLSFLNERNLWGLIPFTERK